MFGIKNYLKNFYQYNFRKKISNDWLVWQLMDWFKADENGHQAQKREADLGFGWLHYGLIRQQKPKCLLCVGSRHGYIPAVMAQACKDNQFGQVDFVDAGYGAEDADNWTGVGYWRTNEGKKCFKKFGLEKYIELFVETTAEFSQKHVQNNYDYIYIDGNHSYEGVAADFNLFWPLLTKGGFCLFHDICVTGAHPEGEYGVKKLWLKLAKKYRSLSIDYQPSGLGVLQK